MKQGIIKKLSKSGKKAMALSVKLSGLGIIGFANHKNDKTGKKIIALNRPDQNIKQFI
jgi:hypothetical protein